MTGAGLFSVQAGSAEDEIAVRRHAGGAVEVVINGDRHVMEASMAQIQVFTGDQTLENLDIDEELRDHVQIVVGDRSQSFDKIVDPTSSYRDGTSDSAHGCDDHDRILDRDRDLDHDHDHRFAGREVGHRQEMYHQRSLRRTHLFEIVADSNHREMTTADAELTATRPLQGSGKLRTSQSQRIGPILTMSSQ